MIDHPGVKSRTPEVEIINDKVNSGIKSVLLFLYFSVLDLLVIIRPDFA